MIPAHEIPATDETGPDPTASREAASEFGTWPYDDDRSPGQLPGQSAKEFLESDADLDRR